jgi:hypothetical protein
MKKYKLIKEYPGSPELGTIVEGKSSDGKNYSFSMLGGRVYVIKYHVEDNPEYWEEFNDNIYWVVFTKEETSFKTYKPYKFETSLWQSQDSRQYFKTEEEAKSFILFNKPCLSYNEVKEEIKSQVSHQGILQSIYHIVKSKL